ncbi:radical SAM protein [Candidatus Woesearchaeota archaeon]|nr:radical SAM protein [Candidatus Woesearchaeota archaeon]
MNPIINKAQKIYSENFSKNCYFERAIFLSWYCSKGDCKFCYMSTQKNKIKEPKLAKRRNSSILAEVLLCKLCSWNIEFLSGGYESFSIDELIGLIKDIRLIVNQDIWLNMGVFKKKELNQLKPHIKGVTGAVETTNKKIHKKVCPSKHIYEIEKMFELCDSLNLEKSITIIIGLGETISDFDLLKKFIKKHNISRITFYALNPHKNTPFKKGPDSSYYAEWIARTRICFPDLEIIAGSWHNRLDEISLLLIAGANSITKFKAIKLFNTMYSKKIEQIVKRSKREFKSNLSSVPEFNLEKELSFFNKDKKLEIKKKFLKYLNQMKKNGKNK